PSLLELRRNRPVPHRVVLDAHEVRDALCEPERASPRSPFDADVFGTKPLLEQLDRLGREPGRVRIEPLVYGQADAIGDVARPKELTGTHRESDIQVL